MLSIGVINALRNCRREGRSMSEAHAVAGSVLEAQFGGQTFVTGQIGILDVPSGRLSWLNAGHPLPLLVRHGHVRELVCRPSLPMGLGGTVEEIAIEQLQPGDRVLFNNRRCGREPLADTRAVRRSAADRPPSRSRPGRRRPGRDGPAAVNVDRRLQPCGAERRRDPLAARVPRPEAAGDNLRGLTTRHRWS